MSTVRVIIEAGADDGKEFTFNEAQVELGTEVEDDPYSFLGLGGSIYSVPPRYKTRLSVDDYGLGYEVRTIPGLRSKLAKVLEGAGIDPEDFDEEDEFDELVDDILAVVA